MNSKTHRIVDRSDRIAGGVRDIFVIVAMTVGLIIASLPPAIILSTSLFNTLSGLIGYYSALVTGIAFAILLEATGVVSSHVAIWLYRRNGADDGRFQLAAVIAVLYMVAGIVSIWIFDQSDIVRIAGTFAYVAALMIYISSALASDMRHIEQSEQRSIDIEQQLELQEKEWQRQQKEKEQERQFQLKMEQKRINERARLAERGVVVDSDGSIANSVSQSTQATAEKPPKPPRMRSKTITKKQRGFLSHLAENRNALRNKSQLSEELGISRPTIDRYIEKFDGEYFEVKNGFVFILKEVGNE